jgi:hypothetical protein
LAQVNEIKDNNYSSFVNLTDDMHSQARTIVGPMLVSDWRFWLSIGNGKRVSAGYRPKSQMPEIGFLDIGAKVKSQAFRPIKAKQY